VSLFPTIFRSTDPGAPVVSGQVGALAALLDAILVDGYGTGANAKTPLGWSREFLSPNLRAYRNNPITGTGYCLRLDDSNALYGLLRGYESMSNVDTGVNPLPTVAQRAGGSLWIKSSTAGGTARPWFAIGNERCLYLFIQHTGQGTDFDAPHFVGDINSYVPGDQHCFALSQNALTSYASGNGQSITFQSGGNTWDLTPGSTNAALFVARNSKGEAGARFLSVASAINIGISSPYGGSVANEYYNFPAPVNGGVLSVQGMLLEQKFLMRGEYPGLRVPLSTLAYGNETLMDGVLISKRFRVNASAGSSQQYVGEVLFELDREWI